MMLTLLTIVSLFSVNAELQRFALKKKSDREFVAGVLARALKGQKYIYLPTTYCDLFYNYTVGIFNFK